MNKTLLYPLVISGFFLISLTNCTFVGLRTQVNINFLIELFNSDRLTKDKILLDEGFEIRTGNYYQGVAENEIDGYGKGYHGHDDFEFIHYSQDSNYNQWMEYLTTNSAKISSILGSIKAGDSLEKINEDTYKNDKITIIIGRTKFFDDPVYSITIYSNQYLKKN